MTRRNRAPPCSVSRSRRRACHEHRSHAVERHFQIPEGIFMIETITGRRLFITSAVLALAAFAASADPAMQKSQPGSRGMSVEKEVPEAAARMSGSRQTPPAEQKQANSDVFDNRDHLVPPSKLSKVKTSADKSFRSGGDIRGALRTKSVTPDGTVRIEAVSPELEKSILDGIRRLEGQKSERGSMPAGGDRDS